MYLKTDAQYLHFSVQSGTTQQCRLTLWCWRMMLRDPEPVFEV